MLTSYQRRKFRVRNSILKNNKSNRPRLVVSRSNKNLYVQLIDLQGRVLQSLSTLNAEFESSGTGIEKAKIIGSKFANLCIANGFNKAVFDKGAYVYNGRVKALAESCREAGLQF